MEIKRNSYLQQLIDYQWDGQVKVITEIRLCRKSYLLRNLFKNYLLENGIKNEQIISVELDLMRDIKYRDTLELSAFVRKKQKKAPKNSICLLTKFRCPIP